MRDVLGWRQVRTAALADWAAAAWPLARRAVTTSQEAWRCGGTWFVGLDALPNDPSGRVADVAFPWKDIGLAAVPVHPAQLSVLRAGYPQRGIEETEAGFRFRRDRDAAHLDGLLPIGPEKRRMVKEPHAWIVGVPLNRADAGASPLVIWEGSHLIMRAALRAALAGHAPETWENVDVTEAYQAARREVFATCRRVELPGQVGEAVILHRLLIHGVAPWAAGAEAEAPGRVVAYFRPVLTSVADWLRDDV